MDVCLLDEVGERVLTTTASPDVGGFRSLVGGNAALWRIVMSHMSHDPDTKAYIERRVKEGQSKKVAMRCLKRSVARGLFPLIIEIAT